MNERVDDWRGNLLTEREEILDLAISAKRVAVLGIRSKARAHRAAHYVPRYLAEAGVEVVPVPVYEPEVEEILGQRVYRKLADIPGEIDLVDVFRRAEDIPPHLPDILKKKPRAVWFQSGIRNDQAAETLAKAGVKVVQNRCLMIDRMQARRRDG